MKKLNTIILLLILTILIKPNVSRSTINAITLTPANPTILSTGLGYYLAGRTYNFTVHVIDPDVAGWADIKLVRLFIPNITNIDMQIGGTLVQNPPTTGLTGTGGQTVFIRTGGTNVSATANIPVTDTPNNFTVTFAVTFLWNATGDSAWTANRQIQAMAVSNNPIAPGVMPAPPTFLPTTAPYLLSTQSVSYGVSSTIRALNLGMTGEASDGRVNRWHQAFNINADAIVYNVLGATIADEINAKTPGEMTNVVARFDANSYGSDNIFPAISIPVLASALSGLGYTFSATAITSRYRATMTTAGGPVDTSNTLNLFCNEVQVTNLSFTGGGGGIVDMPPEYYRGVTVPGTLVRIDANIRGGATAMEGDTTFEVYNVVDGLTYATVVVPDTQTFASAVLTYPATIPPNETVQKLYEVRNITNGSYGSIATFGQNNNDPTRIVQPVGAAQRYIRWNNLHWPSTSPDPAINISFNNGAALATGVTSTSNATSFTLNWTSTSLGVPPNGDFSSYKIYYKKTTDILYTVVDKNTLPFATYGPLGNIATTSFTISSLVPLTAYDYRLSAYDYFGNEVPATNQPVNSRSTSASSVYVSITDGITDYPYTSFTVSGNPDWSTLAAVHPVRKTAIKVTVKIVTGGNLPEEVAILLADNNTDIVTSGIKPQGGIAVAAAGQFTVDNIQNAVYDTIVCTKSAPNTWSGFIPSTHTLMTVGTSVRFIVRTQFGGIYSYVDHKSYDSLLNPPPGNYWDAEWRFIVSSEPKFTPWPTRILNNVITDENPVAYPAYYLTEDANVTITAYDIKGRIVAVILEDAFRKAGQNIKEQGWRGVNKSNRKLGVGLYYIHIKAKGVSSGKVIIDKFNKVVMAR